MRKLACAMACCAVVGACSSRALVSAARAPDPDASVEAGALVDGSNEPVEPAPTAKSENAPCHVDSDCADPYLACRSQTFYDDKTPIVLDVCTVRYQLPCHIDGDCGPAFTCGPDACRPVPPEGCRRCESLFEGNICADASECPAGWSCSESCPCPGVVREKRCDPPFARTNCPECAPSPAN
ncbi:MAG: hypothetical protein JWM82_1501 [Myxococcales bacterium]|nr:hypothetical protein [Myxococcales bacterium]